MTFKEFKLSVVGDYIIAQCSDGWEARGERFVTDDVLDDFFPDVREALKGKRIVSPNLMRGFGKALFRSIFPEKIEYKFNQLLESLTQDEGLRLFLDTERPDLKLYPWEYLCSPKQGHYLSRHPKIGISRWISLGQPYHPVKLDLPLRMLFILSNPPGTKTFNGEEWLNALDQALTSTQIHKNVMSNPSVRDVREEVINGGYHLIHYLGHGEFEKNSGHLIFKTDKGKPEPINEDVVADAFLASSTVKLVCLTACQSGEQDLHRAFSGVAKNLMQKGIPAVIAMQNSIKARDARIFSEAFYKAVIEELPVDIGVSRGRGAISIDAPEGQLRCDFGTPVLFLRTNEQKLFVFHRAGDKQEDTDDLKKLKPGKILVQSKKSKKEDTLKAENEVSGLPTENKTQTDKNELIKQILLYLSDLGPDDKLPLSELCEAIGALKKDVRETLDKLQHRGFVEITGVSRYAILCQVTYEGRQIVKEFADH